MFMSVFFSKGSVDMLQ